MRIRSAAFTALIGGILQFAPLLAQTYSFQVAECGALTAYPSAINNSGVVVGAAFTFDSTYDSGFIYANGKCSSASFGGRGTEFLGITNSNEVIGILGPTNDYIIKQSQLSPLPTYPNAYESYYYFRNAAGLFAGNYYPEPESSAGTGFFYQGGTFKSLPYLGPDTPSFTLYGLNDSDVAVGTLYGEQLSGFIYRNGVISYLQYPGASYTSFLSINNQNVIVGTYMLKASNSYNLFTYDLNTDVWTDLKFPSPYNASTPVGINDAGVIVATYTPAGGLLIATPKP